MNKFLISLIASLAILMSQSAYAAVISSGFDASKQLDGGVRFKGFMSPPYGGGELYVGVPNLGIGSNRSEANLVWSSPGSNSFSVNYNPATGLLETSILGVSRSYNIGNVGSVDYIQLDVVSRANNTAVALNNLFLNGSSLGSFSSANEGWKTWNITGINYNNGFTLSGDLFIDGFVNKNELNKAEISFAGSPVPEPTTVAFGAMGLAGLLGIRKRK